MKARKKGNITPDNCGLTLQAPATGYPDSLSSTGESKSEDEGKCKEAGKEKTLRNVALFAC